MLKTCIIVSPYFPPSMLAGVHRARHLAKHLPAAGWRPIVLCVDEIFHEERLDHDLARLVPSTTEVVKVSAVPIRFTRPLGLGEISLRSFVPLRRNLLRLLQKSPVDMVFISGSPYYPMLLAAEVKRRFGVPVVLDFQDPWVSAWGAVQARFSKTGLSHRLATMFEPKALRGASFITSVSEIQNVQMAERYRWLDPRRMAAIPIGCDSADFEAVQTGAGARDAFPLEDGCIHLSYVGTIWPPVIASIRVFMRAVAIFREKFPALYRKLRLNFVGTTANPNEFEELRVLPLAEIEGVAGIVREIPQRLPYLDALSILSRSDVGLMIGSGEPHYTASKIYPYLMSGKPYLSLFHRQSSAHEILTSAGGGFAIGFSSEDELEGLAGEICASLHRLVGGTERIGPADTAVLKPYEAPAIAHRYAEIFDRLVDERSS